MFDVQESLEHQKVEFNRKEDGFKKREQGLKKKDLELQESLIKFSKFLHGCAILMEPQVREVPYWVDDVSLRQSLQNSASRETGAAVAGVRANDLDPLSLLDRADLEARDAEGRTPLHIAACRAEPRLRPRFRPRLVP